MDTLHFGVAGIPRSTPNPNYINGLNQVADLGLDAFELAFVQFVNMSEATAALFLARLHELKKEGSDVAISVHAPYFVNLNAVEEKKREESIGRVIKAAVRGTMAGATNIVFHPGFYLTSSEADAYKKVHKSMKEMLEQYEQMLPKGNKAMLRPETTGKPNQFGTLDELIHLSQEFEEILPCVDFAHMHARNNGGNNSYDEACAILEKIGNGLGDRGLKHMHIHYSGIEYTEKGERRHLPLLESDANYEAILQAMKDFAIAGEIVCESPILEDDALILQKTYTSLEVHAK